MARRGRLRGLLLIGGLVAVATATGCGTPVRSGPSTAPEPASPAAPAPTLAGRRSAGPTVSASRAPSASSPATSTTGTPTSATPTTPTTATSNTATPNSEQSRCADRVGALSLPDQVGQLFMMGVDTQGLSPAVGRILAQTRMGSVVLLGNSTAGREPVKTVTDHVRSAARQPDGVQVLVAADQEGGQVQRLRGSGFDRMPSATRQAASSDARLIRAAQQWGRQLRAAGIDADLAPVADVVPESLRGLNQPVGMLERGFGPDPQVVADKVSAIIAGMDQAGVATAVKHFPGLGRVRGNTDFAAHVVDSTTTRHDRDLAGFAAAAKSRVDMVMVSTASYTKVDPDHRAAFSSIVIEKLIRHDLGFDGVVISDDLAAQAVRDLSPGNRAVRFLEAGGDLVIVGDPQLARAMVAAVRAKINTDPEFAGRVSAKVTRILAMKQRRGLAEC